MIMSHLHPSARVRGTLCTWLSLIAILDWPMRSDINTFSLKYFLIVALPVADSSRGTEVSFVAVTWISVHVPIEWEKIGSMTRGREGPDFSPIPELSKSFSTSLESVCNNRLLGAIMGAVGAPMTRS